MYDIILISLAVPVIVVCFVFLSAFYTLRELTNREFQDIHTHTQREREKDA
jgi:hypothetical protein